LQRGEPGGCGERHEADCGAVAERRRGDGAAEIDIQATPSAPAVGQGEASQAGVDAADKLPAASHDTEHRGLAGCRPGESE